MKDKIKIMFKQSDSVRAKAITFINTSFPEVMPDIEAYAKANNANVGDVAVITTTDIILPMFSTKGRRHSG